MIFRKVPRDLSKSPGAALLAAPLVASVLFAIGCSPKKPPDPTPQPSESVAVKPPPPKPKLCESLSEDCVGDGDKARAKVASSNYVFIPPKDWTYAMESGQTIAKKKGEPLAIAAVAIDLPKAQADQNKTLAAAFTQLADAIGVALPEANKKKWAPEWGKGEKTKIGANEYMVWENTDAKLSDKGGNLLTFTTKDGGGKTILGVAFAPADDAQMAVINHALETFGPGEP
jgi:hypothetical protein